MNIARPTLRPGINRLGRSRGRRLSGVVGAMTIVLLAACQGSATSPDPGGATSPTALPTATSGTDTASSPPSAEVISVVATTTVLADLVANVGGDRVEISSLVPPGGEVHTFDPTPSDAARIAQADLIAMNGLGLDEWLGDLASEAGAGNVPVVELAEDLDGVDYREAEDDHEGEAEEHEGEEEEHGPADPHLWLNVSYAHMYVDRIAETLSEVDPHGATTYHANAATYRDQLDALESEIQAQFDTVPEENRRIVSFHEAFGYFAEAYGLEIVGTVVEAPGQDPSAGDVAALIEAIRDEDVRAIFSEVQFSDDLVQTIAAETEAEVVSDLYNDSLGDPPVDSYEGLMRWNVEQIVAALQ
ncbi:metal ABC transporter substrate-binding protein [soil metagenome]